MSVSVYIKRLPDVTRFSRVEKKKKTKQKKNKKKTSLLNIQSTCISHTSLFLKIQIKFNPVNPSLKWNFFSGQMDQMKIA